MKPYTNRAQAGNVLAELLQEFADQNAIVLALPRGGVPVGFEVAKALHLPLDVLIVRKLGAPFHEEFAIGAIAHGGMYLNDNIVQMLQISPEEIQHIITRETAELQRREQVYRGIKPFPSLHNKIVILVDDGMATGASMQAAVKTLQQSGAQKLVIAVPVGAPDVCETMKTLVNTIVCPLQPKAFSAVGLWYQNFEQTTDEEVIALLRGDLQ